MLGMSEVTLAEEMGMDALMANSPLVAEGEIVAAKVVEVRSDGVLVDVGMKLEGFIPLSEFGPKCPFKTGDEIQVFIRRNFGHGDSTQVSWKKAAEIKAWEMIQNAFSSGSCVSGKVTQRVKGGFIVDVGLDAFLPASQIDNRPTQNLEEWIGQEVNCLVLECDRKKSNVVVSRRRWLEKEQARKKEITLKDIGAGQTRHGRVTGITSFGAFLDVGGVEGLLHVSDLNWKRPAKVSDVLKVGDELDVKVLKFDREAQRLSLGLKQLSAHPWEGIDQKYAMGQVVKGVVSGLASFGAFVELEPGIEGLIHLSEISWTQKVHRPNAIFKLGQTIEAKIISIDRTEQKMGLSFKRMGSNPWEDAALLYPAGTRLTAEVVHMTSFGAFLKLSVGVEGLLRVQDLSWTKRIKHPNEILKPGQKVDVVVLEVNSQLERVSLGLKQLSADPLSKLKVGQVVTGKITSVVDFGAFVELESGLEALVKNSEMFAEEGSRWENQENPSAAPVKPTLTVGQKISAVIIKVLKRERKLELSIGRYEKNQQRELIKKYTGSSERPTLGETTGWGQSDGD